MADINAWGELAGALVVAVALVAAYLLGRRHGARSAATLEGGLATLREATAQQAQVARAEQAAGLTQLGHLLGDQVGQLGLAQRAQLEASAAQAAAGEQRATALIEALRGALLGAVDAARQEQARAAEGLRGTVQGRLEALQADNAAKLEQMRVTVDEKLHATLEQRLGESFRQVSERLEMVSRGLGEMRQLAGGVSELRRVLGNIKTRGTWGEVQLGALLAQLLTNEQFAANVRVHPGRDVRVDFAVRLPGQGTDDGAVWLPIDAKFPQEDYERLLAAGDVGDQAEATAAGAALEARLKLEARKIHEKYICPPHTVDFAVMFLPVEGLFAEALRRRGLFETLMQSYRVVLSGPTTLAAMLNSLQMGFRSLAIERRTAEVWQLLGAVKTEFGTFGEALARLQKKLQEASHTVDKVGVRSRAIERRLRDVQSLTAPVEAADEETTAADLGGD